MTAAAKRPGPWTAEGVDLVRAVSGGLLFGIPLLFTMEVWWVGTFTEPGRMVAVLVLALLVVVVLNRTSGFRSTKDVRLADAIFDGLEAVAIGVVSVLALLFVLQEITVDTPAREAMGKTIYEAVPFIIGIGLAHHFLRRGRTAGDDDDSASKSKPDDSIKATVADLGATVIGAVFIAFNIAPTDEVPMLAARMGPLGLLGLVAVSLVVSFSIVFVAGFANEELRHSQQGVLQHPLTETVACYFVSLVCAAAMLWFFQRLDLGAPLADTMTNVLVLGLPASIGGAAGRLAV